MKTSIATNLFTNPLRLVHKHCVCLFTKYFGFSFLFGLIAFWTQTCESKHDHTSFFFPHEHMSRARINTQAYPWAAQALKDIVTQVESWMELSDDDLWDLMFSHTLERAWMVWSDGHCPACKNDVVMYNWKINAWIVSGQFEK